MLISIESGLWELETEIDNTLVLRWWKNRIQKIRTKVLEVL